MSILMLINLKGGVAKTTNAVAIAECLASSGYRTLLIDADHQCMSSELLLGEDRLLKCEQSKHNLHDLMAAMLDPEFIPKQFESFISHKASNINGGLATLAVLPCSIRIDDFSTNMAKARRGHRTNDEFLRMLTYRRRQLRNWINANFDFTVIDCPASLAIQVRFLIPVADSYIIPCIPERLSIRGADYLVARMKSHGFSIRGLGTLWSLYREQNRIHRHFVARGNSGSIGELPRPFKTVIPNAAMISASSDNSERPASFRIKYTPPFARLYEDLCEEMIQRSEWFAPNHVATQVGGVRSQAAGR